MALNTVTGGYILQGSHQPRTPGKVRELKICLKIQGKVRELLRKWLRKMSGNLTACTFQTFFSIFAKFLMFDT